MKKYLPLVILAVIAIAIGGGFALIDKKDDSTPPASQSGSGQAGDENSGASDQPAAAADEVEIENQAFLPANITVKRGATVTWTNKDTAEHTVTSDSASGPKSGTLKRNDSYSFTFNEAGEFSYLCNFHPSMAGKVTVT